MADFLHERRTAVNARPQAKAPVLPNKSTAPVEPAKPPTARRQVDRQQAAMTEVLKDFQAGIGSMRGLTEQLKKPSAKPVDFHGERRQPSIPLPPAISKIAASERHTVEKLLQTLPVKERELLLREFESRTHDVIREQVPNVYAAVMRGASELQPAQVVLRPPNPSVVALMQAARALRYGRVPFLPKETRAKASALLTEIYGKRRSSDMMASRDVTTRQLIEEHRLIPQAVQAAIGAVPERQRTRVERELQMLLQRSVERTGNQFATGDSSTSAAYRDGIRMTPLSMQESQRMAMLPAMHTGGAVMSQQGANEFRVRAGEGLQVVTPNDLPSATPDSPSAPRVATPVAPQYSAKGLTGGTAAQGTGALGALGSSSGGSRDRSGSMKIEGKLEIPGMRDWIAKIEGKVNDLG